jgi:hypothetical protein
LKPVHHIRASSAETIDLGAFNSGFETINLHRLTMASAWLAVAVTIAAAAVSLASSAAAAAAAAALSISALTSSSAASAARV